MVWQRKDVGYLLFGLWLRMQTLPIIFWNILWYLAWQLRCCKLHAANYGIRNEQSDLRSTFIVIVRFHDFNLHIVTLKSLRTLKSFTVSDCETSWKKFRTWWFFLNASAGHWKRCGGPHVACGLLFGHPCFKVCSNYLVLVVISRFCFSHTCHMAQYLLSRVSTLLFTYSMWTWWFSACNYDHHYQLHAVHRFHILFI